MGKEILVVLAFALLVWLALSCDGRAERSHRSDIQHWANQNGYTVTSLHRQGIFESNGPFYFRGRNAQMFRIDVNDHGRHRCFFMRSGVFSDDFEEYFQ